MLRSDRVLRRSKYRFESPMALVEALAAAWIPSRGWPGIGLRSQWRRVTKPAVSNLAASFTTVVSADGSGLLARASAPPALELRGGSLSLALHLSRRFQELAPPRLGDVRGRGCRTGVADADQRAPESSSPTVSSNSWSTSGSWDVSMIVASPAHARASTSMQIRACWAARVSELGKKIAKEPRRRLIHRGMGGHVGCHLRYRGRRTWTQSRYRGRRRDR